MAMEAALVSAATGALKPVLDKLGTLLGDEYKRVKGVRKEIEFLRKELTAMHAFLFVMSEEEDPTLQDQVWMTAVRELSYDMEDSIDDFMQNVGDEDTKPEGFIDKFKYLLGKMGKTKDRWRIGDEIKDMKKQIIEVGERSLRYKTRDTISNTKNATVDPRALVIFEDASKLVGIDEPKADIIKLLTQEDGRASAHQHPKLVSIVGSGGMGKTTLANEVYQELKGQFDCHAFLSVSRNPDMMNKLRIILSEVSRQNYATTKAGSIQQLITKIRDFLTGKRYFIVVDDIWDVNTWEVIKLAFPMTSSGSIIITTTRINDVANSCHGDIYGIRNLSDVHSRQLFHRRLFDSNEDCPSHLEKVSDQILKKCDGLPLAIITMSSLLANRERTEDSWNKVRDSVGRALERNEDVERMMQILSLSYFDLPPHLKSCLLYISMSPEDSIIEKKSLIMRWIGEGFIQKEDGHTLYEIGERCFNELLNRSLIQPVKTSKTGKVKNCRVHDTILDFIISKSIEDNFVTLVGIPMLRSGTQPKVIRRLSLLGDKQGNSAASTSSLVLSHVRSFNVFGSMEIPSLEEFRYLRVLDLNYCRQLEDHHLENIVNLSQLRYLNLRRTKIEKLPGQIGRLGCLVMLDLRGTYVRELPPSIVNLGNLSHLFVEMYVTFPDGIAKMQALETLEEVMGSNHTVDFLSGLGQLPNLRKLIFRGFDGDPESKGTKVVLEEGNKAIISSLSKLGSQNLRSLTIWFGSSLLQQPLCLVSLQKLITHLSPVRQVPKWVSGLRNLQQLSLEVEGVKQDDLCILGALPSLVVLHLNEAATQSTEVLRISGEVGFRFLKIFRYSANFQKGDLMFVEGAMPRLQKLEFFRLYAFETMSPDLGIGNLPSLIAVRCDVYGYVGTCRAVKEALERAADAHPNHPALLFRRTDQRGFSLGPL
ncbi:unnamed protein product [Alopecurus aequalis]